MFVLQAGTPAPKPQPSEARNAVMRALPLLQQSAAVFAKERACVSCHHSVLPILTLHLARQRGIAIDSAVLSAVEARTFADIRSDSAFDKAVQASTLNDPTPDDSYLLMAAGAARIPSNLILTVYARRLAAWQRDGHWVTSDFRPPHSSSEFTATATAIRAMRLYMPEEMRSLEEQSFAKARRWMIANRPLSTEDASFRLLGLVWANAPQKEIRNAERDLTELRRPDGGWPQLRSYESDAYSTGEALYALSEAGMANSAPEWSGGLKFLISSQAADGTWRVRSRMLSPATVSPPYFDSGFPYEHDEFLSYAGTCWAVMALLRDLPEVKEGNPPVLESQGSPSAEEIWKRTALFGSASQLRVLLDAGLDANTATPNGTTLLMMSATDASKVALLLSRGAKPATRSSSGTDALTVAAAYRGTAASIRIMLAAGVEADPPPQLHLRRSPLTLAAMTGDMDSVRLLLKYGADATSGAALSEAVTFGYPDVVRALVHAQADPEITESSGINLLHWITVANRTELVPVLAGMGVPVNALDKNGFSPLMYAVTLDFGDTRTMRALLKAGANPKLANLDGRDSIAQAEFLKHTDMLNVMSARR